MKAYRTVDVYTTDNVKLDYDLKLRLPDGCIGMQLVFKTKKALREFAGKKAGMVEVIVETEPRDR